MYCIWMTLHLLDNILLWIHCCLLLSPCKHLSFHPFCAMWRTKELFSDTFYNQLSSFAQSDHLKKKKNSWHSFLKHLSLTSFRDPYLHWMLEHGRKQRLTKVIERDKMWMGGNGRKDKVEEANSTLFLIPFQSKYDHLLTGRWGDALLSKMQSITTLYKPKLIADSNPQLRAV